MRLGDSQTSFEVHEVQFIKIEMTRVNTYYASRHRVLGGGQGNRTIVRFMNSLMENS